MLTERIKELESFKAKVQELQNKIISERPSELAALPEKYGFSSLSEFLKAVKDAYEKAPKKTTKRAAKAAKKAAKAPKVKAAKKKTRTRAKITEEVRLKVKELAEAGKSGSEIASTLSISLPSVQNIKKAYGLVKTRAEAPAAVTEAPAAS